MKITRTDNTPTNVKLEIEAESADLEPIKKHVLTHFAASVKVPGFRQGKAPMNLVEKNVNQQAFLDEFLDHALNELYKRAVENEKLRPVGSPDVQIKKFVPYTLFSFEADMQVLGPIKLADYKKIKVPKPKISVTAKDVEDVIKSLQGRMAERKETDQPAKAGDEVVIDFKGSDEKGEPVNGADGKDYPLHLGSNTFIPGFEDKLIGVKAGEDRKFTLTFPKDYGVAALQSKKVTFEVNVKKVQELVEPKVDDAFAAKVGPFKTVAELKADVKKQITSEKQYQADRDYENELIKNIADKSKVEIPEALIEDQITRMEDEEKRNLVYRGQTWQEHLEAEGISEEQHRQRQRPDAEARVKAGLVLSEISEQEKIDITPEELEMRLQILKGQYQDPAMQAELDKPENRRDIASRMMTEKTIAKLVEYSSK